MAHARHRYKKWITRRPITPYNSLINGKRPGANGLPDMYRPDNTVLVLTDDRTSASWLSVHDHFENEAVFVRPAIQPGHAIWWKETSKIMTTDSTRYYPALLDGRPIIEGDPHEEEFHISIPIYRATDEDIELVLMDGAHEDDEKPVPWTPSILMKRKWARFVDAVIAVRPERLLDITDADAIAEGISTISKDGGITWKYGIPDRDGMPGTDDHGWPWHEWCNTPREAYLHLWAKLNGQASVDANPWLWVYAMDINAARP